MVPKNGPDEAITIFIALSHCTGQSSRSRVHLETEASPMLFSGQLDPCLSRLLLFTKKSPILFCWGYNGTLIGFSCATGSTKLSASNTDGWQNSDCDVAESYTSGTISGKNGSHNMWPVSHDSCLNSANYSVSIINDSWFPELQRIDRIKTRQEIRRRIF